MYLIASVCDTNYQTGRIDNRYSLRINACTCMYTGTEIMWFGREIIPSPHEAPVMVSFAIPNRVYIKQC